MRGFVLASILVFASCCTPTGAPASIRNDARAAMAVCQLSDGSGSGSAFPIAIDEGAVIFITARHCVPNPESVRVLIPGLGWVSASRILEHLDFDAALVWVPVPSTARVPLIRLARRAPVAGERVILAGFSKGMRLSLHHGIVSSPAPEKWFGPGGWHVGGTVWHGMSGGAMISETGEALAILVARDITGDAQIGYVVSIQSIRAWIDSAI